MVQISNLKFDGEIGINFIRNNFNVAGFDLLSNKTENGTFAGYNCPVLLNRFDNIHGTLPNNVQENTELTRRRSIQIRSMSVLSQLLYCIRSPNICHLKPSSTFPDWLQIIFLACQSLNIITFRFWIWIFKLSLLFWCSYF